MSLLKIGDHTSSHSRSYVDMDAAIKKFRGAGIEVGFWHYVYGGMWSDANGDEYYTLPSPDAEAAFAKTWIEKYSPIMYVIDAEKEYKLGLSSSNRVVHPASRAGRFMVGLQGVKCPIALSSYRYPSLHREFPFATFMNTARGCDIHMPQVYWGDYTNAGVIELTRSYKELMIISVKEFVPVGRAYLGDGHGVYSTIGTQIAGFGEKAIALGNVGVNFWSLDAIAQYDVKGSWSAAIKGIPGNVQPPVEEPPVVVEKPSNT